MTAQTPTPFLGLSGSAPLSTPSYSGTPGPGPVPSPWKVNGATVFYDEGGAVVPSTVPGGSQGKGTMNAGGLFVNGVPVGVAGEGEPPSGPAGGDLAGTYPDPTIKPSVALSGNPTTPTPAPGDDDLSIANSKFVTDGIAAAIAGLPPLTVQPTGIAFGATGTGDITSDAPAFNWDDTNKRLGIGIAAPTARIEVDSPTGNTDLLIRLRFNALDKFYVDTTGNASVAGGVFALGSQFAQQATAVPVGGIQDVGYLWSSTPHLGMIFGTGLPNKAMAQGSWYQRVDATALIPPLYYNVDGTATGWLPVSGGGGGASVSVGATPPTSPTANSLWWSNVLGTMFIYYNDGNSTQWVPAAPAATQQLTGLLQTVSFETGAYATGTTVMPNTLPTNTQGDQYMQLSITPRSATSRLIIEVVVLGGASAAAALSVALFQDATVNALAATGTYISAAGSLANISFRHVMTSGTTSPTTFKVRMGPTSGTCAFNGTPGGQYYGGAAASSILIQEVAQ